MKTAEEHADHAVAITKGTYQGEEMWQVSVFGGPVHFCREESYAKWLADSARREVMKLVITVRDDMRSYLAREGLVGSPVSPERLKAKRLAAEWWLQTDTKRGDPPPAPINIFCDRREEDILELMSVIDHQAMVIGVLLGDDDSGRYEMGRRHERAGQDKTISQLRTMLEKLVSECEQHNREYDHHTEKDLLRAARRLLKESDHAETR